MPKHEHRRLRAALSCLCAALVSGCPLAKTADADEEGALVQGAVSVVAPLAPVARVDSEKAWLDLLAQRPKASSIRDGELVIDLGRQSAQKFLALGGAGAWKLGVEVDTKNCGLVAGRTASLDIPLDGPLLPALHPEQEDGTPGLAMAVTIRSLGAKQYVTVLWDETPLANLKVSESWSRRTFSIPTELAHAGENRLRFHFKRVGHWSPTATDPTVAPDSAKAGEGSTSAESSASPTLRPDPTASPVDEGKPKRAQDSIRAAAAIASVEVGTLAAIRAGEPASGGYELRRGGESVFLPGGTGLVFYLTPPPRARLEVKLRGRGGLEVLASTDEDHRLGRAPARLDQRPLREAGNAADIDLSGYGGVPTRLQINITGADPEDGARLDRLEIQVERSRPVDRRARESRDVFVIGIEGARPDEVYGAIRGPAKREYEVLRDFLGEALVFERAYAPGAAAVPSHAGWMSSVSPSIHLTINGTYVSESQELLPERLARAGYFNTVVTANRDVNMERGLIQGFAKIINVEGRTGRERAAPALMARLLEQYRSRPSPRFSYLVVSDTQAPYDPPREELLTLDAPESGPAAHLTHMWVARVQLQKIFPGEKEVRYVRSLYQAELSVVDRALGALVAELEAAGTLDDSIIAIMGVHGEEFLEHGSAGHGKSLFEESIRVPLAIRAPTLLAPGRVKEPVDLLDLAPTLTDLLGIEPSARWEGESLVPLIDDPHPPPRLLVSSLGDGSRAAIIGNYKLILGSGSSIDSQRYFDLVRDPSELHPLREGHQDGVAVRMLINALSIYLAEEGRWKRARWGTGANLRAAYSLDHGI